MNQENKVFASNSRPAFVTFTGVDNADLIPAMQELSSRFPIEWGVLIDPAQEGNPLFPRESERRVMVRAGLRFSAHVCGQPARTIVDGKIPQIDLGGFSRVQINHGRSGSDQREVANSIDFGARMGVRPALQCQGQFPSVMGVDWLYDISFGTGRRVENWPALTAANPFCGYSGGLNHDNVLAELENMQIAHGASFWIDMESGVRTEGKFDIGKCQTICEAVYGTQSQSAKDREVV